MKTEALIHRLAAEIRPVRPIRDPAVRFLLWSLAAVLFTSLVIGWTGVRPDLGAAFAKPTFVLRALFLLGIAFISVFSAFRLSVPGETKRWIDSAPAIAVSAFLILLVYVFFASDTRPPAYAYSCVRNVLAFSLPTGALLYLMLQRAAPMKAGLVGMIASLGSAALSSLGTEFVCRHDDAAHVFVSHFLPVLAASIVGVFIGRWIFNWNSKLRKLEP